MMEHEQASLLLADYIEDRLDEARKTAVEVHRAKCEECRKWIEAYDLMSVALSPEAARAGGPHPSSELIARIAIAPEEIPEEERIWIAAHVESCTSCSEEAQATREAAEQARGGVRADAAAAVPWWKPTGAGLRLSLAASLAIAALGLSGYLGLVVQPRLRGEADSLRAETGRLETRIGDLQVQLRDALDWSGAVGYLLLGDAMRGEGEMPSLRLRADQPYVALAVQPELPLDISPEEEYRFEIRSALDQPVWSIDLPAAVILRELTSQEVVFFQIPAARFAPGDYELRMREVGMPGVDPILRAPFRIEEAEGTGAP